MFFDFSSVSEVLFERTLFHYLIGQNVAFIRAMTTHLLHLFQKYDPFRYAAIPQAVTRYWYLNRYNDTNLTSISNKMIAQYARLIMQVTEFPAIYYLQFTFQLEDLGANNDGLDGANRRGQLVRNDAGDPSIEAYLLHLLSHNLVIANAGLRPQVPDMNGNPKPDYNGVFNPTLPAADQINSGAATNVDVETWISAGEELFTSENIFTYERPPMKNYISCCFAYDASMLQTFSHCS